MAVEWRDMWTVAAWCEICCASRCGGVKGWCAMVV